MFHKIITFWLVVFSFQNLVGMEAAETPSLEKQKTMLVNRFGEELVRNLAVAVGALPKKMPKLTHKALVDLNSKLDSALEEMYENYNAFCGTCCGYRGCAEEDRKVITPFGSVSIIDFFQRNKKGGWESADFEGGLEMNPRTFKYQWQRVSQIKIVSSVYAFLNNFINSLKEHGLFSSTVPIACNITQVNCIPKGEEPHDSGCFKYVLQHTYQYAGYLTGAGDFYKPVQTEGAKCFLDAMERIIAFFLPEEFFLTGKVFLPHKVLPYTPAEADKFLTVVSRGASGEKVALTELGQLVLDCLRIEETTLRALDYLNLFIFHVFPRVIKDDTSPTFSLLTNKEYVERVLAKVEAARKEAQANSDALAWAEAQAKKDEEAKETADKLKADRKAARSSSRSGGGKASGGSSGGGSGSSDAVPQPGDHVQTGRSSTGDAPSPRTASVQVTLQAMAKAASGNVIPEEGGDWLDPRGKPVAESKPQAAAASKGKSEGKRRHGRAGKANNSKKPDPTTMPDKESASGRDSVRTPTFTDADFPPLSPASKSVSQKVGQEEPKPVVVPRTPCHSPAFDNTSETEDGKRSGDDDASVAALGAVAVDDNSASEGEDDYDSDVESEEDAPVSVAAVRGKLEAIPEAAPDEEEDAKSTDDKDTLVAALGAVDVDDGTSSEDEDAPDGAESEADVPVVVAVPVTHSPPPDLTRVKGADTFGEADVGAEHLAMSGVTASDDGTASEDEDAPDGEGDLEDADGSDGQGSEAVASVGGGLEVKPQEPVVASPFAVNPRPKFEDNEDEFDKYMTNPLKTGKKLAVVNLLPKIIQKFISSRSDADFNYLCKVVNFAKMPEYKPIGFTLESWILEPNKGVFTEEQIRLLSK